MELRMDYFMNRFSVILGRKAEEYERCPYCPGNEEISGPADLVLVSKKGALTKKSDEDGEYVRDWSTRAFRRRNPISDPNPPQTYSDYPHYMEPSYGYHYVVVATPKHAVGFHEMELEQWENALMAVQSMVKWLYGKKGVSYVGVFANYGRKLGVEHAHFDLVTFPRIPPRIEEEVKAIQRYRKESGRCLMCKVLSIEGDGPRQVLTTGYFVAFCPWAPMFGWEFWIAPKRHEVSFVKISQKELRDLGLMLRSTLGGFVKASGFDSYTMVFHIPSEKKSTAQFHWHIEVYPAEMEPPTGKGLGIFVSQTPPERVARVLSKHSRKELSRLLKVD